MTAPASSTPACPKCHGPIPAGAPEGLCPACLVALNLLTQTQLTDAATTVGSGSPALRPLPPPPSPESIAPLFPQLELHECLGRGGMGVVYRARQKSLDRLVALKLLAPERGQDPAFAERFQREARALARLSHPGIVTIHDFGQAGGYCYLLMEFVDGVNLRQLLQSRKLSPEEALAVVPTLCEALQYAHERGIVHRDIKPENLLLDCQGRIKIADFGIAKLIGGTQETGASSAGPAEDRPSPVGSGASPVASSLPAAGTPAYMAPEQKTAPQTVDRRADIYSLGVVFYEMLTGERPAAVIEPPSRKVSVDVRIDQIVLRALEKTPELRWQTAADLQSQLATLHNDAPPLLPGSESTEGGSPPPPRPVTFVASPARHSIRGVLVGLAVLLFIISLTCGVILLAPISYEAHVRVLAQDPVAFQERLLSDEILLPVADEIGRDSGGSVPMSPDQLRKRVKIRTFDNTPIVEVRTTAVYTQEAEQMADRLVAQAIRVTPGVRVIQGATTTARLARPNDGRRTVVGLAAAVLLGALASFAYARASRRRTARLGDNPPAHLTTDPVLGLVLVLLAFLVFLGGWLAAIPAHRMLRAKEDVGRAMRTQAALLEQHSARNQHSTLQRQVEALTKPPNQRNEAPSDASKIFPELNRLEGELAKAAERVRRAENAVEFGATSTPSRRAAPTELLLFLCVPLAIPGTWLGLRHLQAIRGWPAPRYRQSIAMWAGLSWPVLLAGSVVFLLVLLPLNHGRWAVAGLILATMFMIVTDVFLFRRTLAWLRGEPFFSAPQLSALPSRQARWLWAVAALAFLAVLLSGPRAVRRGRPPAAIPPDYPVEAEATTPAMPAAPAPMPSNPVKPVPAPAPAAAAETATARRLDPVASAEQRALAAQYEKVLTERLDAERSLALIDTETGLLPAVRDEKKGALELKIKVLAEQQETLRHQLKSREINP